ncbi:MAG: methyltransferase domain-containing protein, partial [Anaerolineae bacterium]|nr:methyltransferase domain-containing protein [Anaerolineae bacterium]
GMVHWEASPGSVILDLVDHVMFNPDDVFFDLGAGIGNIAILVNLLTGVRVIGIEREPVLYTYAQQLIQEYALENVNFVNADARDADLGTGSIFYLFTPFVASILDEVMKKLRIVAQDHRILVCSFGPCTPQIAQIAWLKDVKGVGQDEFKLAIFQSDLRP